MANNEFVSAFLSTARVLDGTLHGRMVRDPVTGNMERDKTTLYVDKDFLKDSVKFDAMREEAKYQIDTKKGRGQRSPYDIIMDGIDIHKCIGSSGTVDEDMKADFESAIRTYIVDTFSTDTIKSHEYLDVFFNESGDFVIGPEQALVFYRKSQKQMPAGQLRTKAQGLFYLLMSYALEQEFSTLYKSKSTGGVVVPLYNVNEQLFTWKRATSILRKYALYAVKPKDFDCFYIEITKLCHKAFLYSIGKSAEETSKILEEQKAGLFYSYLTLEEEAVILPEILSGNMGGFDTNNEYVAEYRKLADKITAEYKNEMYNVYTLHIKPIMIETMGIIVKDIDSMVEQNGFTTDDIFIYNLTPNRLGIACRSDLTEKGKSGTKKLFGDYKSRLVEVKKPLNTELKDFTWL